MDQSLTANLLYLGIAGYVIYLYRADLLKEKSGQSDPRALPGATSAGVSLYATGIIGALLILAIETIGEVSLGIADEQNDVVWHFVFASLAAGIIEEVIFRGFLVVDKKGRSALVASCLCFSVLFALLHPYLWELKYPEGASIWQLWLADFNFVPTTKAFFTTTVLFLNSLWFYVLRFGTWNKKRSLLPCMVAHSISNLGVFIIKWAQGHVVF